MNWKDKFMDVIDDFLTVQSFITLGAFGVVYVMTLKKIIPPDVVIGTMSTLLGYWFGTKQTNQGGQK